MPCWSFWWLVFSILFFFSGLLSAAAGHIVLAYLLGGRRRRACRRCIPRRWAASIVLITLCRHSVGINGVCGDTGARQQGIYLIRDMPGMLNKLSILPATLPRRYPALMDAGIDAMAENMRTDA